MPPTGMRTHLRGPRPSIAAAIAPALALLLLFMLPGPAEAGGARLELGPAFEYTNLIYRFTDLQVVGTSCDSLLHPGGCADSELTVLFRDTLLVSRDPEKVHGAYVRIQYTDTVGSGRFFSIEPELRLARQLVTGHLYGSGRWLAGPVNIGLDQRFEHTLDQRFGLSRRLDSEQLTGLVELRSSDRSWTFQARPRAQLDRTDGDLGSYLQDSNAGRLSLAIDHFDEQGGSVEMDLYAGARAYPDSAARNYRELFGGLRLDRMLGGGLRALGAGELERRAGGRTDTRHDLFTRWRAEGELDYFANSWKARLRAQSDGYHYQNPDDVYFDNRLLRVDGLYGRDFGLTLGVELKPRFEMLRAASQPDEEYNQVSAGIGATRLGGGLLDVLFEAGRRHYLATSSASGDSTSVVAHTDYHLYSASALLTQPVGAHFRLKGTLDYQAEVHDDATDNNHIIFASAELGYSFRIFGR